MRTALVTALVTVDACKYQIAFDPRTDAARFIVATMVPPMLIARGLLDAEALPGPDIYIGYDDGWPALPPALESELLAAWLRYRLDQRYPGST